MKIKTSELTGATLDWAVLKAIGNDLKDFDLNYIDAYPFSTDWSYGGPIIERENISVMRGGKDFLGLWCAECVNEKHFLTGPTPLIAATRCYCCSKLGDEIDIPEELCQSQNS